MADRSSMPCDLAQHLMGNGIGLAVCNRGAAKCRAARLNLCVCVGGGPNADILSISHLHVNASQKDCFNPQNRLALVSEER